MRRSCEECSQSPAAQRLCSVSCDKLLEPLSSVTNTHTHTLMFWISADLSFFLFFFSSKVLLPDRSSVDGGSVEINSRGFSACQRLVAWHHEPPQPHYPAALLYSPPTPTLTATDTQPPPLSRITPRLTLTQAPRSVRGQSWEETVQ